MDYVHTGGGVDWGMSRGMIRISSRPRQGAPSFTGAMVLDGDRTPVKAYEPPPSDVRGMISVGPYMWLAPVTVVVESRLARRARTVLQGVGLVFEDITMGSPVGVPPLDGAFQISSDVGGVGLPAPEVDDAAGLVPMHEEEDDEDDAVSDCEDAL